MKVPHAWSGSRWTCIQCGESHPDPCSCRCCGLQTSTDDPEMAGKLRRIGDGLRERYGQLSDRPVLAEPVKRRSKRRG